MTRHPPAHLPQLLQGADSEKPRVCFVGVPTVQSLRRDFVLMLICHHLKILGNFLTKGPALSF